MKRLFALLMVIAMLFCVSACGNKPSTKTDDIDNQTTEVNKSDDITTDDSYESIDPESWGITDRFAAGKGASETFYINLPKCTGVVAGHGDGTVTAVSGENESTPEINGISEVFPAYLDDLQFWLEDRYGSMRFSNFEFELTGNAPTKVGDYDMHTFTGVLEFDYVNHDVETEHRVHNFVAYSTALKSNGAYAYWLVYDESDDQSNGDLIKEHALNMAKTFREEE